MNWKNHFDPKYLKISLYTIFTAGIIYGLSLLLGQYAVLWKRITGGISWVAAVLKPLLIGMVIAYIIYPICRFYERKLQSGKPRMKNMHYPAAVLSILTVLLALGAVIAVAAAVVTRKVSGFNMENAEILLSNFLDEAYNFQQNLHTWMEDLDIDAEYLVGIQAKIMEKISSMAKNSGSITAFVSGIRGGASTTLFSVLFAVYFLLDGPNLKNYWGNVIRTIWSQKANDILRGLYRDADTVFSGYFRGQITDAIVMALLITVSFSIIGMPYGAMIGLLAGVGNMIPYMGPVLGYGLTLLAGVISGELRIMAVGMVVIFIIQAVDGAVINPRLLSDNISIHPMLVLLAMIAGNRIGGILGMVTAVPVAALLKIWFERFVEKRKSSKEKSSCKKE